MTRTSRLFAAFAAATVITLGLSACGGGASDTVGGGSTGATGATLNLYAYSVPKPGFDQVIPAFQATDAGKNVKFEQSYGASGDQSRKVAAGAQADIVNFSVEPDITRLVDAGLIESSWNADATKGIPFGSVVSLIVRKGNPKNIHDWDDLLRPGIEVVTPNPFSSGSAKWNLLAPYAAKSDGGKNPQAGLDYLTELVGSHVKAQPASGREATEAFLQGTGDVLIGYEDEAINVERQGKPVEHVIPPVTFKIENPVAVLKNSPNLDKAVAFRQFLYTKAGQEAWAKGGFRPVDPAVAAEYASTFPQPATLWTISDLGGWKKVDAELFAKGTGKIAVIYGQATK